MKRFLIIFLTLLTFLPEVFAHEISELRTYTRPVIAVDKKTDDVLSTASGVAIAPGYILSVGHGIPDVKQPFVTNTLSGDKTIPLEVVKIDRRNDLVLLKGEVECPCIQLSQYQPIIDDEIIGVGFPLLSLYGVQYLYEGRVQALFRKEYATSITAAPGSSGGGLFIKVDGKYQFVGLIQSVATYRKNLQNWLSFGIRNIVIEEFLKDTPVGAKT